MKFTPQELEYLTKVMDSATTFTKAKAEQIDLLTVDHDKLKEKIHREINRLHGY
tara:strand:- start:47 stop:208 length:162 start_codon:yes stop_codon:yes gene_type:complete